MCHLGLVQERELVMVKGLEMDRVRELVMDLVLVRGMEKEMEKEMVKEMVKEVILLLNMHLAH